MMVSTSVESAGDEAVRMSSWCGTSQERHEGGAPYHRTVRRATGLWIVASVLFTTPVPSLY